MKPNAARYVRSSTFRAAAAVMVTAHHAIAGVYGDTRIPALHGSVDVFFVISGMILWITTVDRPVAPSVFLRRRLLRIAPLYWAVTTAMVIVLLTAPGLQHTARFDLAHILASYVFVPWPHPPPYEGAYPLLVPGWTLNYEVFFYVLFAIALTSARRIRGGFIVTTLAALVAAGHSWPDAPLIVRVYTSPIILEFGLGVAMAMLFDHARITKVAPRVSSLLLLTSGCTWLLLVTADEPMGAVRLFNLGIPAAMIVAGAVIWERARIVRLIPPVLLVGNASYAIVLTHTPLLAALALALNSSWPVRHPPGCVHRPGGRGLCRCRDHCPSAAGAAAVGIAQSPAGSADRPRFRGTGTLSIGSGRYDAVLRWLIRFALVGFLLWAGGLLVFAASVPGAWAVMRTGSTLRPAACFVSPC